MFLQGGILKRIPPFCVMHVIHDNKYILTYNQYLTFSIQNVVILTSSSWMIHL